MSLKFNDIIVTATPEQMANVNRLKIFLVNKPHRERLNLLARIGTFFRLESEQMNEHREIYHGLWDAISILFLHTILPDVDGIVMINHPTLANVWFDLCVKFSTFQPFHDLINAFISGEGGGVRDKKVSDAVVMADCRTTAPRGLMGRVPAHEMC